MNFSFSKNAVAAPTFNGRACLRYLAGGATALLLGNAAALPGDPDPNFGSSGRMRFTHSESSSVTVRAAARMSDGRIVVAAQCVDSSGHTSFCLSRISTNGTQDSSFSRSWHHSSITGQAAIPYAVAVDSQDRVLVAGACVYTASGSDMCVARFLPNGNIDGSFAFGSGFVAVAIAPGTGADQANAIVLTADGGIVLGGSCDIGGSTGVDFCLAKLTATGARDPTIGLEGKATHSWNGNGTDLLQSLVQDATGSLYAGGSCTITSGERHFCVMGISPSGFTFFKKAYGVSPTATLRIVRAMALTYDNKLVLTGQCSGGVGTGIDFCTIRVLLPSGDADPTFGATRITAVGFQALNDDANSIVVEPDGRYVIAGTCGLNPTTIGETFCFARYAPDGQEDRSIHSNTDGVGTVYTEFILNATNDRAAVVLRASDGGFVLVGSCERTVGGNNFDICAAKYQSGPNLHAHCTPDIDGDGTINPLIDGIILSRLAAGMRTDAVMNGIATPSHALRRGWNGSNGIAAYLDRVCGVRGLSYAVLIVQ
jgi:uncharacterized delta-60 repeat protein